LEVISSQAEAPVEVPPTPPAVAGIDVNFCKNPCCANFGVPANFTKFSRRKQGMAASVPGAAYKLVGSGKGRPALECLLCYESFSVKSNLAVAEEYARFTSYLAPKVDSCCPTAECANHLVPIGSKVAYSSFGVTNAGTPRYRCKLCQKTFSAGGRALKRQRITHQNKTVLLSLVNKMPIRRIAKVTGLNAAALYGKIDFLHRQCIAFSAHAERELPHLVKDRMYISVDRQEYMLNWTQDADRRNIVVKAVGSCDNDSGFVFGMNLNFDKDINPENAELDAVAAGDPVLPYPHRKYARLWVAADYAESLVSSKKERVRRAIKAGKGPLGNSLGEQIADAYEATSIREDSEVSDLKDENQKLPDKLGMQVHEEYSLYGHFLLLKHLLPRVEKLRFFLDQDSGIRAACLSAFAEDVKAKRVDAFYVRIAKELTVDRKRSVVKRSKTAFNAAKAAYSKLTDLEVAQVLMITEIDRARQIGQWQDRWAEHPLPDMSEPAKAMCYLTDLGDAPAEYDISHSAHLFLKASMRGVDNFFQRVRRSVNPLERPIQTASKSRRTWYGYSPYNPIMVEKLLGIYRTMHNYVEVGKDGKTPAMRLGLIGHVSKPEDIIYFDKHL
jgi:transposase-like protein